ncbi:MAG: Terminase-like family [Herbinix sp.]|jgi:hypothetical protein|nr:Terminase-like family [Herbinix sp.]
MALSKESQMKLSYLWEDEHKIDWIETFIKIADKESNIVPFILTDEQREFVDNLDKENVVLKSRQLGLSSVVIALSIRACIVKDNITSVLISHDQKSTNAIFAKLKQQFFSLPDWIRPELLTNNRQELSFANGGKITCMTAGNKDLLRGETVTGYAHLSEFAFWKNPEKQMKAISQAISETGIVVIESTADGFNKFSETYYQAKNGENSYKPFFFNWINGKTLFLNHYRNSVTRYTAIHGKPLSINDLDETEIELRSLGATLDQLTWRRQKIATDGLETFNVEYPSTDTECFTSTGTQLFDAKRIETTLTSIIRDKIKPLAKDKIIGLPVLLQQHYGTSLSIWKIPVPKEKYYIGVDCSEGIGQDYSTAIVLDKNGEQVAEFKNNKIKPYQLADIIDTLGRYYNKGKLIVEKASGGHALIQRLKYEKKYGNMEKYKAYDEFNRVRYETGFDTNNKTKSLMVNEAREWFEKGLLRVWSRELLEEMKVYIMHDNGSMGAVSGSHDDLVMALCLAIVGIKSYNYYPF